MHISIGCGFSCRCNKDSAREDENAWIHDESLRVPVLFGSASNIEATTKAIQDGLVTGSVMNSLDVGIVGVAEKQSDATPVTWSTDLEGSILIANLGVTTTSTGAVVFSPKI